MFLHSPCSAPALKLNQLSRCDITSRSKLSTVSNTVGDRFCAKEQKTHQYNNDNSNGNTQPGRQHGRFATAFSYRKMKKKKKTHNLRVLGNELMLRDVLMLLKCDQNFRRTDEKRREQ